MSLKKTEQSCRYRSKLFVAWFLIIILLLGLLFNSGRIDNLKYSLSNKNDIIDEQALKIEELNVQVEVLSSNITSLVDELNDSLGLQISYEEDLTISNVWLTALGNVLKSLKSQVESAKADNELLEQQIADLQGDLTIKENELSEKQEEYNRLLKNKSDLELRIVDLDVDLAKLHNQLDNSVSQEEYNRLLSEKNNLVLEKSSLVGEVESLNSTISDKNITISSLQGQKKSLEDQLQSALNGHQYSDSQYLELQERYDSLNSWFGILQNDYNDLERERDNLSLRISSYYDDISDMSVKLLSSQCNLLVYWGYIDSYDVDSFIQSISQPGETTIYVPYGLDTIPAYCFYKNPDIEYIQFPPTVEKVDSSFAFGLSRLSSVEIWYGEFIDFTGDLSLLFKYNQTSCNPLLSIGVSSELGTANYFDYVDSSIRLYYAIHDLGEYTPWLSYNNFVSLD